MKLEGIRVLDLSQFLPGPHLTMMMADHGADVIKIEPPTGEPVREVGLRQNGHSVWFRNTHRNKRCMTLDLKRPEAVAVFLQMAASADVIVEAFRPGVVARLGIGYEAVRARNPGIVYCSISAFGQTGPLSRKPAHDLSIQAETGLLSVNLGADGTPAMPGMPAADMAASLMALSAILMALLRRAYGGGGDYIDLSMQDALLAWTPNVMGPPFAEGRDPVVRDERSWGGAAMYGIYATADGRHLSLGGSEPKFAASLLGALGRPDLAAACRLPPGPAQEEVRQFLRATFATRSLAEWTAFMAPLDVCWAPVRTLTEALASEQVAARGMLVEDPPGQPHLGLPIRFREEPGRLVPRLDQPGESTAAILAELGLDAAAVAALRAAGAV
ncbi:CoA transferase [Massilia oculi]|uniref:CoA transferase n=1 Tax=Massilia hydrophila TaxID=3044279 RepID=A0ABS7YCD7_9BURK|nr:CoA transferase [Massilia oculi]MCA1857357.1 CoA transferase [Massilia oculi]